MDWANPKSIEATIKRLTKEINEIDQIAYSPGAPQDRLELATLLEHKRDDVIRSAVLQLHTSIDDLLTDLILYRLLGITKKQYKTRLKSVKAKALRKMLYGAESLGFDMKLNFAVGIGLLTTSQQKKLMELNTVRNKCSHHWILRAVIRRGRRPAQKKPPLLSFRGQDLHKVAVFKEFFREYSMFWVRFWYEWTTA
jgi:hypothetical protein